MCENLNGKRKLINEESKCPKRSKFESKTLSELTKTGDPTAILVPIFENGKFVGKTLIDADDADLVSGLHLILLGNPNRRYVYVYDLQTNKRIALSHIVAGKPPAGFVKDHINWNILDNRKCNLRDVSLSLNAQNQRKKDNCSSRYYGVTALGNRWKAKTTFGGLERYRIFDTEVDAAKWYDSTAVFINPNARTNKALSADEIAIARTKVPESGPLQQRNLPKYVFFENNRFRVRITKLDGGKYSKSFATREEAAIHAKLKYTEFQTEKERRRLNQPITRDNQGRAVIITNKDESRFKKYQVLVDEEIWQTLNRWTWYWDGQNSSPYAKVNGRRMFLRRYVWEIFHGPITHGKIKHMNGKLDCRKHSLKMKE